MKLDLAKAVYEAQWFDFGPGTRLKIRPYPATLSNMAFRDGAIVIAGASSFDMFQHCLVDWDGVNDAYTLSLHAALPISPRRRTRSIGRDRKSVV